MNCAAPEPTANNTVLRTVRPRNIVISGSNFWNPGDDFVREGVMRVLRETLSGEPINFVFYNFNPDLLPNVGQLPASNLIAQGDLEKFRHQVDAVVVVGVSAGDEVKPLYRWVVANGLEKKVYLISGHYESRYCADHITGEPEATIFRNARILIGRTKKFPDFIQSAGVPYHHVNCPALLSVPEVKVVAPGKKIERIGFSIQLPRLLGGLVNQFCADEPYQLAVTALSELARQYQVEVVAHHKTEYFHFLNLLQNTGIPVIFSSFYHHLFETYRRYDLVITTRLHASLFANGHGVPGIIINDTDRHTHTLEGFPHSPWVNTREAFQNALARWQQADLSAVAREADEFKSKLLARYVQVLRPVMVEENQPAANATVQLPEPDEPAAVSTAENISGLLDGVQRILFVRTDSIGDVVLASAMLEPLRKKFPQAKLAVLCQQHVAELFAACPLVDSIICYDRKKMDVPAEREQIISEIAAFQPDVILNPVRSRDKLSDDLTLGFASAQHIAIEGDLDNISEAERDAARGRYEVLLPTANTHKAELDRHANFLRGLGIEAPRLQPVVWTSPEDEALADAFFQQEKLDPKRTLALFPFTQHAIKDYPDFAAALKDFAGWDVLLLGGAETRGRCDQLAGQLAGRVRNLAGRTSLREMAAIIRRCRILVGSDTCAPHVACAVGVPNVVVLGGGHFGRFMPYSPLTTAVALPLDCFGCNWRCQYASAHCITRLMPEAVAAAIAAALKGSSEKPTLFAQTNQRGIVKSSLSPAIATRLKLDEIDFTPVVMNRPVSLAWPSLQYGEGVHKDEGDFRWLDTEAGLQASVPENGHPVNLAFELRAGQMAWYPRRLLRVEVAVNDRVHENLTFQTDHQFAQIRLHLPPAARPHSVRIRADQFFTGNDPARRLAVQLRQVRMTEAKPVAMSFAKQKFVLPPGPDANWNPPADENMKFAPCDIAAA